MLQLTRILHNLCIVLLASLSLTASAQEARYEYGPWVWSLAGGAVSPFSADFSDGRVIG